MFRKINNDCVESSEGFIVEFFGMHHVRYIEGDRAASIEVEGGTNKNDQVYFEIYPQTLKGWLPPYEYEFIASEKKERILKNIDDALTFLGIRHIIGKE